MKRKFTLIELLVVIAIIAILATLFMPALSSAREKSRQTSCINNLRNINQGFLDYYDNYKSYIPVTYDAANAWATLIAKDFFNKTSWNKSPVFFCPSNPKNSAGAIGFGKNCMISYSFNSAKVINYVTHPSLCINIADNGDSNLSLGNAADRDFYMDPATNSSKNSGYRHQQSADVLFFDGHVKPEKMYIPNTKFDP